MDISITGRNAGITDRFRQYATEKSAKIAVMAERALALEIRLCRHHEKNGHTVGGDKVELTLIGPGPVVRAESSAADKYAAFDLALDRMLERLRRAKDRRKVHRGQHRPHSLHEAAGDGFRAHGVEAAPPELLDVLRTGEVPVQRPESEVPDEEQYNPVVIRRKVFPAQRMTVDDAVDQMELVGHDFFLFVDVATERPSVVYRRKGWNYGVICLEEPQQEQQQAQEAPRAAAATSDRVAALG